MKRLSIFVLSLVLALFATIPALAQTAPMTLTQALVLVGSESDYAAKIGVLDTAYGQNAGISRSGASGSSTVTVPSGTFVIIWGTLSSQSAGVITLSSNIHMVDGSATDESFSTVEGYRMVEFAAR